LKLYYANADFKDADLVVLGLPFDRTSSFIPGSRFGPQFIRQCSDNIEDYSPYQEECLFDLKICDSGDHIFTSNNPMDEMEKTVSGIYGKDKIGIFLGGEHTISYPIVKAIRQKYREFSVVHFDAHCDLRDEYLGEKICHATAIRRVSEIVGIENVHQFGIRSGTKEEFEFNQNLSKFESYEPLKSVIDRIEKPIYITLDVDVLDPSILPAVATPEPGGISYPELIDSLLLLKGKNLIGADIVEYNPLAAPPFASGSTVAAILRELLLIIRKG